MNNGQVKKGDLLGGKRRKREQLANEMNVTSIVSYEFGMCL